MLLRLTIQNFLSFYEPVTFDMFPNPKREFFTNHIYSDNEIPVLKQAAIYGENAAGKSNFVKAIAFLDSFVSEQDFIKDYIYLDDFRYQLAKDKNLPIYFLMEFCQEGRYYIYEVQIGRKIVERLYHSGLGQQENELVFERSGTEINSPLLRNEKSAIVLLSRNEWSSLISLNAQYPVLEKDQALKDINSWFRKLNVITLNTEIPLLIELLSKNKQILEFANKILADSQITTALTIKETPLDEWILDEDNPIDIRKRLTEDSRLDNAQGVLVFGSRGAEFSIAKGEKLVKEFLFKQIGVDGYTKDMYIRSQSDGTIRLLTLIPAFYEAMYQNHIIVIDEIENSMHPDLIYRLVKYFANNKTTGQLIFTTHLSRFQNQQELMRPDELWMVEKRDGFSTMRSFNDFNIHRTMNIEKGYQEGRYGGVPMFINVLEDGE